VTTNPILPLVRSSCTSDGVISLDNIHSDVCCGGIPLLKLEGIRRDLMVSELCMYICVRIVVRIILYSS